MRATVPLSTLLAVALTAGSASAVDGGGAWSDRSPLNVARQEVGAARIGNAVYVAGGLTAFLSTADTVERYDPATDAWTFVAPMPAPRHHLQVASEGGKLYVLGGYGANTQAKDTAWVYDPASDVWSAIASLPEPRAAGWAVGYQGRVFVFGGVTAVGAEVATTLIYDVAADQWSTGADMLLAREHVVACALGDSVYVVGGRLGGLALPLLERYDPAADAFTTLAFMPTARSAMAVAPWHGRIVVSGGEAPMLHDVTEVYDVDTDTWSCQDPMPVPRHGVAAVALDDGILVPGGGVVQGFTPTDHADVFVPGSLVGDVATVSLSAGATQTLDVRAGPAFAGQPYLVLGSLSGSSPGVVQGPFAAPLNPDAYTLYTANNPGSPPLAGSAGLLDVAGLASAAFTPPAGLGPAFVGLSVNHAFGVVDLSAPGLASFVSNAEPVVLVP